jgi:hypothetical protein
MKNQHVLLKIKETKYCSVIGDGILYTEDDVNKICSSTPSSLGLIIHESFILLSKEEGIMTTPLTL